MKLTKKDEAKIYNILSELQRVERFLLKETTIVAVVSNLTSMPEDTWLNKKTGESAHVFNKQVGNELCYLYNAIRDVGYLLKKETSPTNINY